VLLKLGACGRVWVGMGIFRLMVMLMARAVSARRDYLILRYRVRGHSFFFFFVSSLHSLAITLFFGESTVGNYRALKLG
jgi:hypothetical protein